MLLRARTVLPVCAPPIDDGAVLVRGEHIEAVGSFSELRGAHAGAHGDMVASLMTCAPQNAWLSVINGRIVVDAGALKVGIDMPKLIARHNRISDTMLSRAGFRR